MKKKYLALLLACTMALTACGGSKEQPKKTTDKPKAQTETNTPAESDELDELDELDGETDPLDEEFGGNDSENDPYAVDDSTSEDESVEGLDTTDYNEYGLLEYPSDADEAQLIEIGLTKAEFEPVGEMYGFHLDGNTYNFPMVLDDLLADHSDWQFADIESSDSSTYLDLAGVELEPGENYYIQVADQGTNSIDIFVKNKTMQKRPVSECRVVEITFSRDPYPVDDSDEALVDVVDFDGIGFETTKDDVVALLGEPQDDFEDSSAMCYYTYDNDEDKFALATKTFMFDGNDVLWYMDIEYIGE